MKFAIRNNSLVPCIIFAVCGCHQPAGELFPVIDPPMVWPAPPEAPRIKLVGMLSGSADLRAARSGSEIFQAALRGPRPPIKLSGPHAVAHLTLNKLAIADGTGGAVHIVDLQARSHVVSYGSTGQRFAAPVGVAWAGDSLFVSDAQLHEIIEMDPRGRVLRSFGSQELLRPVGLVYIPVERQLYVVDGSAHALKVFDLDGRLLRTIGSRGAEPGQFNYPTHIAYNRDGLLAVADTGNFRVQLLDLDGICLRAIGQKGDAAGDLALPKGVAFDSDGHLYVVDSQFENLQIFDIEGRLLLAIGREGDGPGRFSLPAGLTIDEQDRIWVADSANRRVQVFQYLKEAVSPQLSAASPRMEN